MNEEGGEIDEAGQLPTIVQLMNHHSRHNNGRVRQNSTAIKIRRLISYIATCHFRAAAATILQYEVKMAGSGNDLNMSHPTLHKTLEQRPCFFPFFPFFFFFFFLFLRAVTAVKLPCPWVRETNRLSLFEFRVSKAARYAPGTPIRLSEGLAIAEDGLIICQDPGQDRRGPRQMPITKKAKRRNYDAYVSTHGTRCHLLPHLVTAWDLQPTRKEQCVYLDLSIVCTMYIRMIHKLQSPVPYIDIQGIRGPIEICFSVPWGEPLCGSVGKVTNRS